MGPGMRPGGRTNDVALYGGRLMGKIRDLQLRAALGAVGLLVLACSGDRILGDYPASSCDLAEPPADLSGTPLRVATFWTNDSHEGDAYQTLVAHVDSRRYFITTDQLKTRSAVQLHIKDAFESQQLELPDVFQANAGSDVLRWVDGRDANTTQVCSLEPLQAIYGWRGDYFPAALAPLSCRGTLYGLPVGVHHLNLLFYNRARFEELSSAARARGITLSEPEQLTGPDDLLTLLDQVSELGLTTTSGAPLVPLALGTSLDDDSPLTIVAFENVLLSLGQGAYETLWTGGVYDDGAGETTLRAALKDMLSVLEKLVSHSNFSERKSWQEAVRQVGTGDALFTVTGDWGWAQLDTEQAETVRTLSFPGTDDSFVYTPDSFAVPREPKENSFPARYFLQDVVADKSALIEFSNAKHSIPPRNDLTEDEVQQLNTEDLRATYRRFQDCSSAHPAEPCKLLLAVSGLGPAPGANPCFDETDEILALAVAGIPPQGKRLDARRCDWPFPRDQVAARTYLIERLLEVGKQTFAAACR